MNSQEKQLLQTKNAALEKELAHKITELQQKEQELAIEAALERVRVVAMSMRTPADLPSIGEIIFKN